MNSPCQGVGPAYAETVLASDILSDEQLVSPAQALRLRLEQQARAMGSFPSDVAHALAERMGRLGDARRGRPQHAYQSLAFAAGHVEGTSARLGTTFAAGMCRLELSVPAQLRLLRFRVSRKVRALETSAADWLSQGVLGRASGASRRARRNALRILPLLLLMGATVACGLVGKDGDGASNLSLGPMAPELSKTKAVAPPSVRRKDAPWTYVLPVDHGVRADRSGQGYFRAPRFHGEHNGLDLLAPVGTPVFSPCKGQVMAGVSQSFGHWAHIICPAPENFVEAGVPHPWVSFFYAHLDKPFLKRNEWLDIGSGEEVGQVGKSGNARGDNVQPHLHLELIVQRNKRAAMDERHLGKDQSNVSAAEHFASVLNQECMERYGFESKTNKLQRARRIDPFIALTCLGDFKPNFKQAPSPLTDASREWAQYYTAKDFNVNLGVEDSLIAKR